MKHMNLAQWSIDRAVNSSQLYNRLDCVCHSNVIARVSDLELDIDFWIERCLHDPADRQLYQDIVESCITIVQRK